MNGNPFDGDVPPHAVARYLQSTDRLASMLNDFEVADSGATPAAMLADTVNNHRADIKRIGAEVGVEVEVERMTPDRAADLLAGLTDGNGVELLEVFNAMAHDRDKVLRELLDSDEHEQFMQGKAAAMHTPDPETWDDERDG